jgi:FxLD family lantipeptide
MSPLTVVSTPGVDMSVTENPFSLDVQIITDIPPGHAQRACQTDDGCDPSCASACVSTSR